MSDTPAGRLTIERFTCSGSFHENCYLLYPSAGGAGRTCWIVDPGAGQGAVISRIDALGLSPEAIVLTHGHVDHIAGVPELRARFADVGIWIGELEADALQSPRINMSEAFGLSFALEQTPTRLLKDGERLLLGAVEFEVILASGHSPGGICLYCPTEGELLVGDVILMDSIGRTDTVGGDLTVLLGSIRDKLMVLPPQTRIWSGHGPLSTLARQAAVNEALVAHGIGLHREAEGWTGTGKH
ncbi:MAG: Hydroxyacylglutathione hydrolase GloC [Phycisphaerae bacterium]|nr:Hydroxyacylglutathione hydrolase GloC [Phycisphaerae bacterium]